MEIIVKEADKHAQGKQERKKVYCGGDHCSGLWNLPCNAPEHPRVEPLQARKECEIRIMDGWCWTHSRYHCTQEPEPKKESAQEKAGKLGAEKTIEQFGDTLKWLGSSKPDPKQGWEARKFDDYVYKSLMADRKLFDKWLETVEAQARADLVEEIKHLYYNCEDSSGLHADEFWEGLDHLQERNK